MSDVRAEERELDQMAMEDEKTSRELSIAQKKALIRRAKEEYGSGWKKAIGGFVKNASHPNMEVVHTMYSQGLGDLRDLSDPRRK